MKTVEQIKEKIEEVKDSDVFGFKQSDLIDYLPFEDAKPFLKDGVTTEEWTPKPLERESIIAKMHDYMSFAWEKANNCRGISAARSLSHYAIWVWIIGDEEKFHGLEDYEFYGKPNLIDLCEFYGWDHEEWDDGERVN